MRLKKHDAVASYEASYEVRFPPLLAETATFFFVLNNASRIPASFSPRASKIFVPIPDDNSEPQYCTVYNHLVKSGGTSIKLQLMHASAEERSRRPGE